MHFVYILFSFRLNEFYIGSAASPFERLKRRNAHHKGFTGRMNDWIMVFMEEFQTQSEALQREKQNANRSPNK